MKWIAQVDKVSKPVNAKTILSTNAIGIYLLKLVIVNYKTNYKLFGM